MCAICNSRGLRRSHACVSRTSPLCRRCPLRPTRPVLAAVAVHARVHGRSIAHISDVRTTPIIARIKRTKRRIQCVEMEAFSRERLHPAVDAFVGPDCAVDRGLPIRRQEHRGSVRVIRPARRSPPPRRAVMRLPPCAIMCCALRDRHRPNGQPPIRPRRRANVCTREARPVGLS